MSVNSHHPLLAHAHANPAVRLAVSSVPAALELQLTETTQEHVMPARCEWRPNSRLSGGVPDQLQSGAHARCRGGTASNQWATPGGEPGVAFPTCGRAVDVEIPHLPGCNLLQFESHRRMIDHAGVPGTTLALPVGGYAMSSLGNFEAMHRMFNDTDPWATEASTASQDVGLARRTYSPATRAMDVY